MFPTWAPFLLPLACAIRVDPASSYILMRYAYLMKRTTVMLADDVEARLRYEARRRGVSLAQIVREAVEREFPAPEPGRPLAFFAVGEGGPADASERVDEFVRRAVRRRRRG